MLSAIVVPTPAELTTLARQHPLEGAFDAEGVELQHAPFCPTCREPRPCLVSRLVALVRESGVYCLGKDAECRQ